MSGEKSEHETERRPYRLSDEAWINSSHEYLLVLSGDVMRRWTTIAGLTALLCSIWMLWPQGTDLHPVDYSRAVNLELRVGETLLLDSVTLSQDEIVSVAFHPKDPWPLSDPSIVFLSLIPEGHSYEHATSITMMRCTHKSSVSIGLIRNGQPSQISPSRPSPDDPRCYFYAALRKNEVKQNGPCELEVNVARPSAEKSGVYGAYSPMPFICVHRRKVTIVNPPVEPVKVP